MVTTDIKFQRVTALPLTTQPNTLYFVKPNGGTYLTLYVTGTDGVPYPVQSGGTPTPPPPPPPPPTLGNLSLSSTAFTTGGATSVSITSKTAGSTITATSGDGTALSVTGTVLTGTFTATGTPNITLIETLAGASNTPHSSVVGVTVTAAASPATFTMTQLASPMRTYQRSTMTGGSQGLGTGSIPVAINATASGSIYSRIRSSDGTTILRASTTLPAITSTGTQVVQATADARLGWFYVDLSADGATWQNGTTLVGMGRVIGLSGQSLAVRKFGSFDSSATIASLGITVNPNGVVYATYNDSHAVSVPTWAVPADGTGYDSSHAAEFLRLEVPAAGVNCALVGHAHGGTGISSFLPTNTDNTSLRAILDAVGGFEAFIWDHGHADSGDAMGQYYSSLTTLFSDISSRNTVLGNNYAKIIDTIPAITNGYGPVANINALRKETQQWCIDHAAVFSCPLDLHLQDGIHPNQLGGIDTARHDYRATRVALGLANDDTGPILASATRASNSAAVVITPALRSGAKMIANGNPASRITVSNAGSVSALAIASASLDTAGAVLTVTLSSAPANTQALDVYWGYPYDPANDASADMLRDNVVDADGLTLGRSMRPNFLPITAAAPGGSTPPYTGPTGDNVTPSSDIAYGTGKFGQAITKGYMSSQTKDDGWPETSVWTIEMWLKGNPGGTAVAYGAVARGYIGFNNGKALFHYTGATGEHEINGSTALNDGNWHHLALVAGTTKTEGFVDGVSIGSYPEASATSQPGQVTLIGAFQNAGDYGFCGDGTTGCGIDEVAVWNVAKYTAPFTPPTSPYRGDESGLVELYHLDGNGLSGGQS